MKHVYRGITVILCLMLWLCLSAAVAGIHISARTAPYREKFPFPCFLKDTDIYGWSLSSGEDGAVLLVQNIGDRVVRELEIVFASYDQEMTFCCEKLLPGEKMYIKETGGLMYNGDKEVICVSVISGREFGGSTFKKILVVKSKKILYN